MTRTGMVVVPNSNHTTKGARRDIILGRIKKKNTRNRIRERIMREYKSCWKSVPLKELKFPIEPKQSLVSLPRP